MKRRNVELNERMAGRLSGPGLILYFGVPTHSDLGGRPEVRDSVVAYTRVSEP